MACLNEIFEESLRIWRILKRYGLGRMGDYSIDAFLQ